MITEMFVGLLYKIINDILITVSYEVLFKNF